QEKERRQYWLAGKRKPGDEADLAIFALGARLAAFLAGERRAVEDGRDRGGRVVVAAGEIRLEPEALRRSGRAQGALDLVRIVAGRLRLARRFPLRGCGAG